MQKSKKVKYQSKESFKTLLLPGPVRQICTTGWSVKEDKYLQCHVAVKHDLLSPRNTVEVKCPVEEVKCFGPTETVSCCPIHQALTKINAAGLPYPADLQRIQAKLLELFVLPFDC